MGLTLAEDRVQNIIFFIYYEVVLQHLILKVYNEKKQRHFYTLANSFATNLLLTVTAGTKKINIVKSCFKVEFYYRGKQKFCLVSLTKKYVYNKKD